MLRVQNLEAGYGPLRVLKGLSLHVSPGEAVAIIGANGAGKTTLLKTIAGILRPRSGAIAFDNRPIGGLPAEKIVAMGCALVPEGRHVFPTLTVQENLILGGYVRRGRPAAQTAASLDQVYAMFDILKRRQRQLAGTLSGGEQQMLAIGRALMARPRLLLLDEPSLGLAPLIVRKIFEIIREINAGGTTIFLVEQNAHMALTVAHRGYVLQTGRVILADRAAVLIEHPEVKKAYLGG
jgi:branched-chain amino acid transport system ATP-binding protein